MNRHLMRLSLALMCSGGDCVSRIGRGAGTCTAERWSLRHRWWSNVRVGRVFRVVSRRPIASTFARAWMVTSIRSTSAMARSSSQGICCSSSIRSRTRSGPGWRSRGRDPRPDARGAGRADLVRGESLFAIRGIGRKSRPRSQARKEAEAALVAARAAERSAALNVEFTSVRAPNRRPYFRELCQRR